MPVLRQKVPSEVGHEETHLHPHRWAKKGTKLHLLFWLFCNRGKRSVRKIQFLSSKMYTSRLFLLYIYFLNPKSNVFLFFFSFRWKATQMPGVREGVQPELQPHYAQQETHRIQTFRLRPLQQRFPEKGGFEETQGDAARAEMNWRGTMESI